MLKFHLDEHVAKAIARGLRQRGFDVTTTADVNLRGADDNVHLSFGLREGRVIFTNDADFLALAVDGREHAGVAYCAVGARSVGYLVDALAFIGAELDPVEMMNRIEYL